MEISSSGAGSIAQNAPTQTGSTQQINRAEQQAALDNSTSQESQPLSTQGQRVGSLLDVSV